MNNSNPKLIIALDFDSEKAALSLVEQLDPQQCRLKVGKEMFTRLGPQFVRRLQDQGYEIFLDLKFHDIPNTVAAACQAAADLGVWMVNLHALGGAKMMSAAREALESYGAEKPLLIAVTILTSHATEDLQQVGLQGEPLENVLRLAALTEQCGLNGVVCSAQEATALRQQSQADFKLVTPGIRLQSTADDQKRVMTPQDAIAAGVDYLVVGRPITRADDPMAALEAFTAAIGS